MTTKIKAGTPTTGASIASDTDGALEFFTGNPSVSAMRIAANQVVTFNQPVPGTVPSGGIIMWSGAVNNIPALWALCDGNNGTPNLMDRFIVGAGASFAKGATGGTADAIVVAHTHTVTGTTGATDVNHTHSGTTDGMNAGNPHNHGVNDPGHAHGINGTMQAYGNPNISAVLTAISSSATAAANTGISIASSDINHGHGFTSGGMNSNQSHTHTLTGDTGSTGSSGINANLPPYYALAYIMKL